MTTVRKAYEGEPVSMPHNPDCSRGPHCVCDEPDEIDDGYDPDLVLEADICGWPVGEWDRCTRPADHEGECE